MPYMESVVDPRLNSLVPVETWASHVRYTETSLVIDRGGLWVATGRSLASRPISGNTNWTLVAGTPFVDVTLTPPELVSAPFHDATSTGPGVLVIPAPGAGKVLVISGQRSVTGTGDPWANQASANMAYGDATGPTVSDAVIIDEATQNPLTTPVSVLFGPATPTSWEDIANLAAKINQPLVIWTTNNMAFGGAFGSRSLSYRFYYDIVDTTVADTPTFYTITAVNQGTRTLTVSPDPTTTIIPPQSVTVVGSTGQNGSYTALAVTATTIRVKESLPSAVADGWVEVEA